MNTRGRSILRSMTKETPKLSNIIIQEQKFGHKDIRVCSNVMKKEREKKMVLMWRQFPIGHWQPLNLRDHL